jgi:hypothetical protein
VPGDRDAGASDGGGFNMLPQLEGGVVKVALFNNACKDCGVQGLVAARWWRPCIQTVRVQIRYDRACWKTVRVGETLTDDAARVRAHIRLPLTIGN